jgi:phosphoglycolate phosphatase
VIEAVLFDIDGVLMDSRDANIDFYRRLVLQNGYPPAPEEDLARGHTLTLYETIALVTREPNEKRVREIWQEARALEGYRMDLVRQPEGASDVLKRLQSEYRLGVVTGRIREGVEHYFENSGNRDRFELAVSYDDYDHPKPAPEPLLRACERLGVTPAQTVYVGDAETDRLCAMAAGTHFIAYGDAIVGHAPAVTSFRELERAIKGFC